MKGLRRQAAESLQVIVMSHMEAAGIKLGSNYTALQAEASDTCCLCYHNIQHQHTRHGIVTLSLLKLKNEVPIFERRVGPSFER
jgi:hypothetical protein